MKSRARLFKALILSASVCLREGQGGIVTPLIHIPLRTMDKSLSLADTLKCLTMKDIRETLPQDTFSSAEKRSRAKLETAVWNLSGAHHIALEEAT
jgi:hypothetical protein